MYKIDSIVSLVPKKKKDIKKKEKENLKLCSLIDKTSKSILTHKSNSYPKQNIASKLNFILNKKEEEIELFSKKLLSQKNFEDFLSKKFFEEKDDKIFSEKNLLTEEEEPSTPLMNFQKNKKPNYLMKSDFIKDKSLTPQDRIINNNLCPIYDFYKKDAEFNINITNNEAQQKKENNLKLKATSFTQYYNKFKQHNLSNNNKDIKENDQINFINDKGLDKIVSQNDEEIPGDNNTPASIGEAFSPFYDIFDDNIFNHDSNFNKSPMNFKQMNVNININNNQQNNNIYYHVPYIINNANNTNTNNNYYINNKNNTINEEDENENNNYINDNVDNDDIQENEKINVNNINRNEFNDNNQNYINDNNNMLNIYNNMYNNNINNVQMRNINNNNNMNHNYLRNNFRNMNNNNSRYNQNGVNMNNNQNNNYMNLLLNKNNNFNLNQNQINLIKLNQMAKLGQNFENNMNNGPWMNNNYDLNKIQNLNNNNHIINYPLKLNNNINYINNNNPNINFNSGANSFINKNNVNNFNHNINKNNLYNNLNYFQLLSKFNKSNNNNLNNNQFPNFNQNNILYSNKNQEFFGNNNNNFNPNIFYPYQNMYNNNSQDNNLLQNNININLEQQLSQLSPYELVQKCDIFSKYQSGCRYLQDYISSNYRDKNLIKSFFDKICQHIKELSTGQFSHYLVKKILLYLNENQILKLIKKIKPSIEEISTNQYGTKIIQDIIELIQTEKIFDYLTSIIQPYVKELIIDLNGTQIIYKLIVTHFKSVKIIENIISLNVKDICLTKKGSHFLVKYFGFATEENSLNIKKNILINLKDIITDQFGNYAIQIILENKNSLIVKDFVEEINKNLVPFCNNKFASNAVEKCLANDNYKNIIIKNFMNKPIFEKIISDKFGNYVAQRAIAQANDNDRKILIEIFISLIPQIKNQYFGEKLVSKIMALYPEYFIY